MKPILVTLLSVISILSCTSRNKTQLPNSSKTEKEKQHEIDSNDAVKFERIDSMKLLQLGEGVIANYDKEIFRFKEIVPLTAEFYFTAIQVQETTYQLVSKCMLRGSKNIYFPKTSIKPQKIYLDDCFGGIDTFIFFELQQKLDKKDWNKFREILNGSYYWSFTNPINRNDKFDPHSLLLQSKSVLPIGICNDELYYHVNYVTIPLKGSFLDAFNFLGQKSNLLRKLGLGNHKYTYDFRY